MALPLLTFPLSAAQFFDGLRIASARFFDAEPQQINQLADGTILKASLGATLWQGSITLAADLHDGAAAVEALLSLLQRAGSSFLVYDTRRQAPINDPGGVILGAATPTISALPAGNRQISVAGLPVGYVLAPGDLLGFAYSTGPLRHALHRIVTGATADSGGIASDIEVTPPIRAGAVTGAAVQLLKPACKAVLRPGPSYGAGRGAKTSGASFDFIQTLR